MKPIDEGVWKSLRKDPPSGSEIRAVRAYSDGPDDLFVAIDSSGVRHVLAMCPKDGTRLNEWSSYGLKLSKRDLIVNDSSLNTYVDLSCNKPQGFSALNSLISDVAMSASQPGIESSEALVSVVERWRKFWKTLPLRYLTDNEQIGLFAELWFLSEWLIPAIGARSAVKAWKGPMRRRHDFEWESRSVEVKASTLSRGRIHTIHGLDQLDPPDNGKLWLFSICLRKESSSSNCLPVVVSQCRKKVFDDEEATHDFEELLVEVGYLDAHSNSYADLTLRVVDEGLFTVSPDFPRLSIDAFPAGLPSEIEYIEYELNLNSEEATLVATSPADLAAKELF